MKKTTCYDCLRLNRAFILTLVLAKVKKMFSVARSRSVSIMRGMLKVECSVVQACSSSAMADILLGYAAAAGLRCDVDLNGGAVRLSGGESFGFNLNTLRRTVEVTGVGAEGSTVHLVGRADPLPWERPRVRRALKMHLDTLARRLRGEPTPTEPCALWSPPTSIGAPAALGGVLLSGLFAVLAAMLVLEAFGLILIDQTAAHLAAQAERIGALGELPVPTAEFLRGLTWGSRLGAAAFFSVNVGWLCGGILALAWGLGELLPRFSWLGMLAWVYVLLIELFFLVPAGPAVSAILTAFLLPIAAWIGYSLPWSFRRVRPSGADAPSSVRLRTVAWVSIAMAVPALAAGYYFYRSQRLNAGLSGRGDAGVWEEGFRDRVLLGTAWGRALTGYYYRHTGLPAEAIRHPRYSHQRITMVIGNASGLPVAARAGNQWCLPWPPGMRGTMWHYVDMIRTPDEFGARLRSLPEVILWAPASGPIESDPFYAALRAQERAIASRLIVVGGPPNLGPPEGFASRARRVSVPVQHADLMKAIEAVLDAQDPACGLPILREWFTLRDLVWMGNKALVVGAGLLLVGLVVWSAWAWGALGAAAAREAIPRRVAWLAGPIAALAAWGALGAAAIGDAGGPCPPPVPLADAIKSLEDGDPCVRLNAAQQLDGELIRNVAGRKPAAQAALHRCLRDGDPRVRFWAAAALGAYRDRASVSFLVASLEDPDLMVRYSAARSLGLIGDASAMEALRSLARADVPYVGGYARDAIRQMSVRWGGR
jgi:hypothetical protein